MIIVFNIWYHVQQAKLSIQPEEKTVVKTVSYKYICA